MRKFFIITLSLFTLSLSFKVLASNKIKINSEGNDENLLLLMYEFNNYNSSSNLNEIETRGKSPWLAFLLSMFLPTSGQLYNGDYTKAIIQAGLMLGGGGLVTTMACVECGDYGTAQTGLLIAGAAMLISGYFWSIIDAPMSANRINSELEVLNQQESNNLSSNKYVRNHRLSFSSNNLISIKIEL